MEPTPLQEIDSWIAANELALLGFTTPDCGVCDALKPKVAELAAEYPLLQVRYVDLTVAPEAGGRFGVFVVPVFLLFVRGRESLRLARYFGMHELEQPLARYSEMLTARG